MSLMKMLNNFFTNKTEEQKLEEEIKNYSWPDVQVPAVDSDISYWCNSRLAIQAVIQHYKSSLNNWNKKQWKLAAIDLEKIKHLISLINPKVPSNEAIVLYNNLDIVIYEIKEEILFNRTSPRVINNYKKILKLCRLFIEKTTLLLNNMPADTD